MLKMREGRSPMLILEETLEVHGVPDEGASSLGSVEIGFPPPYDELPFSVTNVEVRSIRSGTRLVGWKRSVRVDSSPFELPLPPSSSSMRICFRAEMRLPLVSTRIFAFVWPFSSRYPVQKSVFRLEGPGKFVSSLDTVSSDGVEYTSSPVSGAGGDADGVAVRALEWRSSRVLVPLRHEFFVPLLERTPFVAIGSRATATEVGAVLASWCMRREGTTSMAVTSSTTTPPLDLLIPVYRSLVSKDTASPPIRPPRPPAELSHVSSMSVIEKVLWLCHKAEELGFRAEPVFFFPLHRTLPLRLPALCTILPAFPAAAVRRGRSCVHVAVDEVEYGWPPVVPDLLGCRGVGVSSGALHEYAPGGQSFMGHVKDAFFSARLEGNGAVGVHGTMHAAGLARRELLWRLGWGSDELSAEEFASMLGNAEAVDVKSVSVALEETTARGDVLRLDGSAVFRPYEGGRWMVLPVPVAGAELMRRYVDAAAVSLARPHPVPLLSIPAEERTTFRLTYRDGWMTEMEEQDESLACGPFHMRLSVRRGENGVLAIESSCRITSDVLEPDTLRRMQPRLVRFAALASTCIRLRKRLGAAEWEEGGRESAAGASTRYVMEGTLSIDGGGQGVPFTVTRALSFFPLAEGGELPELLRVSSRGLLLFLESTGASVKRLSTAAWELIPPADGRPFSMRSVEFLAAEDFHLYDTVSRLGLPVRRHVVRLGRGVLETGMRWRVHRSGGRVAMEKGADGTLMLRFAGMVPSCRGRGAAGRSSRKRLDWELVPPPSGAFFEAWMPRPEDEFVREVQRRIDAARSGEYEEAVVLRSMRVAAGNDLFSLGFLLGELLNPRLFDGISVRREPAGGLVSVTAPPFFLGGMGLVCRQGRVSPGAVDFTPLVVSGLYECRFDSGGFERFSLEESLEFPAEVLDASSIPPGIDRKAARAGKFSVAYEADPVWTLREVGGRRVFVALPFPRVLGLLGEVPVLVTRMRCRFRPPASWSVGDIVLSSSLEKMGWYGAVSGESGDTARLVLWRRMDASAGPSVPVRDDGRHRIPAVVVAFERDE